MKGSIFLFVVIAAVAFSLILSCSDALAIPQISSVYSTSMTNNATSHIEGNSFGTMRGSIVSWDDFESHAPGERIHNSMPLIGPTWTCIYGYNGPLASYTDVRSHSGNMSAYIDWTGSSIRAFGWAGQGPFNKLYITYWRYMTGDYNPSEGDNHKQFYLYGNNNEMPQGMPLIPAGTTVWGFYNNVGDSSVPYNIRNNINTLGWNYGNTVNKFQRWEFWIKLNEPYTASNGVIKVWLDGKLGIENYNYRHRYVAGEYTDFRLGHMAQGFTDTAKVWFDDLYIATTQARVEMGNASSWAACTHREIQIPTAWSDNSITITVNQGSFQDGDAAYLFVVDAEGNVSNGYPITIGGGGGEPSDNPPSVSITNPTSNSSYSTSDATISIAGNASDDNGINTITWSSNRGGSGTATNSSGDWTSWAVSGIALQEGENIITVTATDTNNQTATDTITVTYTPSDMVQAWSANEQTGDNDWKDSSVTYCVRLLIQGAQINRSGNQIMLGFRGRSSGDYAIRKVSIAERDPNGGEGDVIDSTWTKVTFDGKDGSTWDSDTITVSAGQEKLSNPIGFPIQEGKDYYVTFKIVSPSVYLNPAPAFKELYFYTDDHTSDVDWSENGHAVTQDYHALSKIYLVPLPSPSSLTVVH